LWQIDLLIMRSADVV